MQIVITKDGSVGRLVTADTEREVIAILSDDGEWIVKNGYHVEVTPAPAD